MQMILLGRVDHISPGADSFEKPPDATARKNHRYRQGADSQEDVWRLAGEKSWQERDEKPSKNK